jgi:hypothetical protein
MRADIQSIVHEGSPMNEGSADACDGSLIGGLRWLDCVLWTISFCTLERVAEALDFVPGAVRAKD